MIKTRKSLAVIPAAMIFAIEIGLVGIMYGLVFSIVVSLLLSKGKEKISLELFYESLLIVLLLGVSLLWSEAKMYGMTKILFVGSWSMFFLLYRGYIIEYSYFYLKATTLLFIVFLIYLVVTIGSPQAILDSSNEFTRVRREWGFSSANPIFLSRHLGYGIISLVFFLFMKSSRKSDSTLFSNLMFVGATIIALTYMILTNSRGPIASLVIAIVSIPLFVSRNIIFSFSKYIKPLVIIVSSLLMLFYIILSHYSLEFVSRRYVIDASIYARFEHIVLALKNINEYTFIFGAGTGDYGWLYSGNDIRAYPHNVFIEVFYENGLLGLSLILYIILRRLRSHYRNSSIFQTYLVACLIYYIVNAQFSGDLIANKYIFVFLILSSIDTITSKNLNKQNKLHYV